MQFVCPLPVHNYSYALILEAVASSLYVIHLKHKDMIRLRVWCGHPAWLSGAIWVVMWGMCVHV